MEIDKTIRVGSIEGACPFHKDCLEGLVAGPSILKRCGRPGFELNEDDKTWDIVAYYMAQSISNLILTVSLQKVILGGGVMKQDHLLNKIRLNVEANLNGYVDGIDITSTEFITNPKLYDDCGIVGSGYLGLLELKK